MSPFSILLKQLRLSRELKQNQFAELLGYEPSYVSALERSEKGPPRQDFLQRLVRGLDLDDDEQSELAQALKASRRQFSLPAQASEQEYALVHLFADQAGNLLPIQLQLIQLALSIPQVCAVVRGPASSASYKEGHTM